MENRVSITKMMFGWSKYGGPNHGLVKEELKEWYCQSCGDKQVKELPSYMIPYSSVSDRDFMRVCSSCEHLLWKNKVEKIFVELQRLMRLQRNRMF